MKGEWKKRGDTYTKRVGGLSLLVFKGEWRWCWQALLPGATTYTEYADDLPETQRAAERFVERLRRAVTP